jgi:hypothetical protein
MLKDFGAPGKGTLMELIEVIVRKQADESIKRLSDGFRSAFSVLSLCLKLTRQCQCGRITQNLAQDSWLSTIFLGWLRATGEGAFVFRYYIPGSCVMPRATWLRQTCPITICDHLNAYKSAITVRVTGNQGSRKIGPSSELPR